MSNIRQIRSISSRDSQDPGQGRGGFSGGGFSGSQDQGMGTYSSGGSSWSSSASPFGGPLISPPIQFHEIPIIQI